MKAARNRVRIRRLLLVAACLAPALAGAQEPAWRLSEWSDEEREFFLDGPQHLLEPAELRRVQDLNPAARREYIETFLNRAQIAEGIEQRRRRRPASTRRRTDGAWSTSCR